MGTMPSLVNGVVIILVWAFFFVSTARARGVGYATRLACVLLGGVTTVTALVWLVLEKPGSRSVAGPLLVCMSQAGPSLF